MVNEMDNMALHSGRSSVWGQHKKSNSKSWISLTFLLVALCTVFLGFMGFSFCVLLLLLNRACHIQFIGIAVNVFPYQFIHLFLCFSLCAPKLMIMILNYSP